MTTNIPIKITVSTSDVTKAARQSEREMNKVSRKAKTTGKKIGSSLSSGFSKFASSITSIRGMLGTLGVALVAKNILDINRKFEALTMQLKTFIGSADKAKEMFKAIQAYAAPLPMTVDEATQAVVRMLSLGLRPTEAALTSFGNIAAGTSKTIMQFVEAVADATTGEFERLKEFGIKASNQGEQVAFKFGGVTTVVKNNATEIMAYLQQLGETKFAGAMANQATTVNGALSVLQSSWDNFADTLLNDESMGYIAAGLNKMADWLTKFTTGLKLVPFAWKAAWLQAEKIFLDFYKNIAPLVDWVLKVTGKSANYIMSEVDYVNKRLAEIGKESLDNFLAMDKALNSKTPTKKIDDFTAAANKNAKAVQTAAAAAKEASERQRALDLVLRILHPDTAQLTKQERELTEAQKKGYISTDQLTEALAKLKEKREEILGKQAKEDQNLIESILGTGYKSQLRELDEALSRATITREQYTQATTKILKEAEKERLDASREASDGAIRALKNYSDAATNAAANMEEVFSVATKGAEDDVTQFVRTGKIRLQSLLDTLAETVIRTQIVSPLMGQLSGLAGSFVGSLFGGGTTSIDMNSGVTASSYLNARAEGGPVSPNHWTLVGEEGPELVKFGQSGMVYNNKDTMAMMKGGSSNNSITINQGDIVIPVSGDVSEKTQQFVVAAVQQGQKQAVSQTIETLRRDPSVRRQALGVA